MEVLERLSSAAEDLLVFRCPGCHENHSVRIRGSGTIWVWDGSMTFPTFSPSILVNRDHHDRRCHFFVRCGQIEFLNDCWHGLRGKTVPMEPVA